MHPIGESLFDELARVKRERDAATCAAIKHVEEAGRAWAAVAVAERERDEARASHTRAVVALKALVEYAEWLERELGRMPSLSVLASRAALLPEKQTEGK